MAGPGLGALPAEFGPIPDGRDPADFRWLGHLGAVQGALATDFGLELVPRRRLDVLIPDEQELPPASITPDGQMIIDVQPAPVWSTLVRGIKVLFGDPQHAPFVLLCPDRTALGEGERPELVTRQPIGGKGG